MFKIDSMFKIRPKTHSYDATRVWPHESLIDVGLLLFYLTERLFDMKRNREQNKIDFFFHRIVLFKLWGGKRNNFPKIWRKYDSEKNCVRLKNITHFAKSECVGVEHGLSAISMLLIRDQQCVPLILTKSYWWSSTQIWSNRLCFISWMQKRTRPFFFNLYEKRGKRQ